MIKLKIDSKELSVDENLTIMQLCIKLGIEIPHFCFYPKLNIAGNCRMCLVEVSNSPKLLPSCATRVMPGTEIYTNTARVQKARESIMEFLLINHPLDCPICDQGGECDLQDQAFKYGKRVSQFYENKRSVQEKDLGPLISTNMTRCIHCTRCVRFFREIAGIDEIGMINRGEHAEIVNYLEKSLTSELSGNVIDLCPVGALTSKPYAYKARSWELKKTESIDVMDALGSNIRIDSIGNEVMRILPKKNDDINEDWISDKARFSYDGLKIQRLDTPYIKQQGKLSAVSWPELYKFLTNKMLNLKTNEIAAIAGTTVSVEAMYLLKKLLKLLNSSMYDANQFGYKLDSTNRTNYLFNTKIVNIEKADLCILIGANPRHIAPVLNARIGKMVRNNKLKVARIGEKDNQTYPIIELGNKVTILHEILLKKHNFTKQIESAKNVMIIVGDAVLVRDDGFAILSIIHEIIESFNIVCDNWNGFNILNNHASTVGALDIGFHYGDLGNGSKKIIEKANNGEIKILYLLAADEIDLSKLSDSTLVVYQGHHGDKGASHADVILPSAAYTEEDGIFVNIEGRAQFSYTAVLPPRNALPNWYILNSLITKINPNFHMDNNLQKIREEIKKDNMLFDRMDEVIDSKFQLFKSEDILINEDIKKIDLNYYMTNVISKLSMTMSKSSRAVNSN
ncbi:NADH-quinone oxidoreductase subunit NuoG [Rickettsia endosymbiont of Cardiosporidium cionae]|uniref:NADH-quinone oxidoreductase subunit NuoG n=1 Tax=Rickettsia endosymbiont of Cardiosporidium cionae TaxID=2777155 RepID=UPI001895E3A5|nr:NADH-quinone oxidoreductase subunit NuoG [Rickettsia endosymbiont of Cardiosporidium cionae]KAF8818901.1 NADH-quinone oxidoreductase subunit G [Rickettsia endosymbiont of Cardiosporidium cionae]